MFITTPIISITTPLNLLGEQRFPLVGALNGRIEKLNKNLKGKELNPMKL